MSKPWRVDKALEGFEGWQGRHRVVSGLVPALRE